MRLFYFFAALFVFCQSFGNHLYNATIRYDYIGKWGTDSNAYLVTVAAYDNCNFTEPTVNVKIYDNLYHGQLLQTAMLPLVARSWAEPLVSANASVAFCIIKNTYTDTVYLPKNNTGYILYYTDYFFTANYPYVFSALIPGDGAPANTMPVYEGPPAYFISVNEPAMFDVSLKDTDGDSLSYTYGIAYRKNYSNQNKYLDSVYDFVAIGTQTGPLKNIPAGNFKLTASTPGSFIIAVEATEYRKGVEIGSYRYYVNIGAMVKDLRQNPQIDLWGTKNKNSVSLSWINSLGLVQQFYIQRKIGNGNWVIIDSTGTNQYGGDNTMFADSIERSYRIKAGGYIGSWFSQIVSNQWKVGGKQTATQLTPVPIAGIKLYPNPATSNLFIELPDNYCPQKIIITDVLGKEVLQCSPSKSVVTDININSLAAGIYFVKFDNTVSIKFIKTN
jgi:hypothetical protein